MDVKAMRVARITVSEELLRDALAMPENSKIVWADWSRKHRAVVLEVTSPDLPEWQLVDGGTPPEVVPIFRTDYDKRPSTWITFDWNFDPPDLDVAT
jgi:hypothetical protein